MGLFAFVKTKKYKTFMAKLYGWGAAVVIIGALFKINHYTGADIMLIIGLGTESIIFFFSAFEPPHVEPDGRKGPLLLFANPLETDTPKQGDPNVVYFGPGVHKPEKIALQSGQTLYLAGGALVKAEVLAQGSNITIRASA